ncbi:MAG: sugar transferase [Acidaminobacteraceae bacterium]
MKTLNKFMKRTFDIVMSSLLLILFSPIFLILNRKIKQNLGCPVLFKQDRPGLKGKVFTMYKYRSMKDAVDKEGNALPDEERLCEFGKKLRSSSLDELPGLINVLKGEMSFVGPRPLLVEYLDYYNKEEARRHQVKPGITGWAQVNGRNAISWEQKFSYDLWYVDHNNIFLDIKILFMTVFKVLGKDGISQDGNVTMEKFRGSGDNE